MKISIIQTTTNILDLDRNIKSSSVTEAYVVEPELNKALKNIKTGEIILTRVCVTKKSKLADYIEIDTQSDSK